MGDIAVTAAKVAPVYPDKAEIWPAIAGETITAGQVVHIDSSGNAMLADEDQDAAHSFVWGVALQGGAAGQAIDILRRGHVYGFTVSSLAHALPVSLSNTHGALLDTGATTNIVARVVPLPDNDRTKVLFFDCTLAAVS